MSDERTCPTCGGALPPDAPEGTCPKCLLAAGFESADGGDVPEGPAWSEVAEQFPDLEILEELGRGGMGVVYKARQKRLDRFVALKVLPREIVESAPDAARFEDRFTREARALARLSHPNIVGVHEFGERDGMYFFLMEYVDGANLRQTMRSGTLSPKAALAIVPQICDALQYAHDQGVVHRDIKPENVLLDRDGCVKIADFGLAKLVTRAADDRTLTRQGLVMGTPHYMAPEQLEKPSEVDHRADIYSLGVVLYEMLTGELPIGRFSPPSEKVRVDVRLDEVVLRSLEKDAARRYQAVSEVKTGIGAVDPDGGSSHEEGPPPVRAVGRSSRLAFWGLMLPVLGIVLGGLGFVLGSLLLRQGGMNPSGMSWSVSLMGAVAGLSVLAGIVLSIAAIVSIRRSDGRLHGMGLAIAGLLLPLFCCLPGIGAPLLWLSAADAPTMQPGVPWPGAVAEIVPAPDGPSDEAPPLAENEPYDDLGAFRVEVELGRGEARFEPVHIGLLGLGPESYDAGMSTSSAATWPPEKGTVVRINRFVRLDPVQGELGGSAALVLGEREIITHGIEEEAPWIVFDVPEDRVDELAVRFEGGNPHRVMVMGRVLRPRGGGAVELTTERVGPGQVNMSVSGGPWDGDTMIVNLRDLAPIGTSYTVDVPVEWPLSGGHVLVIESVRMTKASDRGRSVLTVGGRTFELSGPENEVHADDLNVAVAEGSESDVRLEVEGEVAVDVEMRGRVLRVWKPDDGGR